MAEITKDYLDGLKAHYTQEKTKTLANASALDGAIQGIDVLLSKLAEPVPGAETETKPSPPPPA